VLGLCQVWEKHVKACQAAGIDVPSAITSASSPGAPGGGGGGGGGGGTAASSSVAEVSEAASAAQAAPGAASPAAPAPADAPAAHGSGGAYDPAIHYPLLLTLKKKKKAVAPPSWAKAGQHGSMCFCCKGKKMNPAFF